jgi:hypothetical protein
MLQLPRDFGPLAKVFEGQPLDTAMSDGITGGFAVIGYRGKTWSVRYGGNETPQMRDDGDGARSSLDLVVVATSHAVAKTWYEQQYTEGSNAPPDCFSNNGVAPDAQSAKKQNTLCATCKWNVMGSAVNQATGKKSKACHDRKRMAVVPASDLRNEIYNGPMLLTAPPTSLGVLQQFDTAMRTMGYPYYSYITRFSFEVEEAYPRFKLAVIRALTDEEAAVVDELRRDLRTERIIADAVAHEEAAPVEPDAPPANAAQQPPPAQTAPQPATAAAAPAQPTQTAAPKKRQGRPSNAAKAASAAAPASAAPSAQQPPPAQPAPAQAAPPTAPAEEEETVTVEVEDDVSPSARLDALLEDLLPQGNA